jgi:hypothetical protein
MQNAKDTFYIMLRDRIAALNPARTVVIRNTTRPGVLVEENELATAAELPDAYRLRWVGSKINAPGPMPLVTLQCEIRYATDGNSGNGGMDRGRLLNAMDAELASAVGAAPQTATKLNYAATIPAHMSTNIFWGDVIFGNLTVNNERIERTATVDVFSYQEPDEL